MGFAFALPRSIPGQPDPGLDLRYLGRGELLRGLDRDLRWRRIFRTKEVDPIGAGGANDRLAVEGMRLHIVVAPNAEGYRAQPAFVKAPEDTMDQAIVRFLLRAQQRGAAAVTGLAVHETGRDEQCVTVIDPDEIPAPEAVAVNGRMLANDRLVVSVDRGFGRSTYVHAHNSTELRREPSQTVVLLSSPSHRDRTCTVATASDPRGDLWVSGTLLYR